MFGGLEMKFSAQLGAAAVAAIVFGAPGVANAAVETIDFSGSFGGGTLSGVMILDVVGGWPLRAPRLSRRLGWLAPRR
jgi:hypothetical protein